MTSQTCLAVMYHYVRDAALTPFPEIRALPSAFFEQQLDWLEQHYRFVTHDQLVAAVKRQSTLPSNAALLTFDDGFVDHYSTVMPVFRRRGLAGVFFLSHDASAAPQRVLAVHKTHFLVARLGAAVFAREVLAEARAAVASGARTVFGADRWEHADEREVKSLLNYELPYAEAERVLSTLFEKHLGSEREFARDLYLNEAMVREMAAAGMTFGYHTRSHRMLSRLSIAEQESELLDGVEWIKELTGQHDVPFCYPWGGVGTYTADTLQILGNAGYSLAFNTVRRRIDPLRDDRFEMPRIDTRDLPPYTEGEPPAAAAQAEEA